MYAVEMLDITKTYKRVVNDKVCFRVKQGEIHSLLGENGAGKSTLMNILYGLRKADSGRIRINEKHVTISSPMDAIHQGIAMVHQHFMLVDSITVAENIVLGNEPRKGFFFDREKAFEEIGAISEKYHLQIDPRELVENLSVGVKQRVEILKALYNQSSILILDEPTAVLTPQEVDDLFVILRGLKEDGKTIIIITHKLKETMAIADTISVLRRGQMITTLPITEVNEQKLAELMVGRVVSFSVDKQPLKENRPEKLKLSNITLRKGSKKALKNVTLTVRGGEILGIAGVEGNGQTELIDVLTGICNTYEGHVTVNGTDVTGANARKMLDYVGTIPEDRGKRGYVKSFTNWENMVLGYHTRPEYCKNGLLLNIEAIRAASESAVEEYDIRCDNIDQLTASLSGGNQQKVIIGRVLKHHTGIVLAAQPTRGVDIGAIEYIHSQLIRLRDEGAAVILISADLDEIVKVSDEIAVLYEGEIVTRKPAAEFTDTSLGEYMLGHTRDKEFNA